MYSEGWFCTVIVGWQTACTVCTAGTVAVVVAVAVVVTVAVAVAVAAAVAGGKCPPLLLLRLFPLRVLPPAPAPAPSYSPLPADPPKTLIARTSMVVYSDGPHSVLCPARCAQKTETVPVLRPYPKMQGTKTWKRTNSYSTSKSFTCFRKAMLHRWTAFCLVPNLRRPVDSRDLGFAPIVKGTNHHNMDGDK